MRRRYLVPQDFVSDGCSVPFIFRPLYRKYKEACRWHDWARQHLVHHKVMTVQQADWEFRSYMKELGAWQPLLQITWLAVKLARDKYNATLPVPARWKPFLQPQSETNATGGS